MTCLLRKICLIAPKIALHVFVCDLVDVSDFFFFCSGRGKGESEAPGRGGAWGGSVFIENPTTGGVSRRGRGRAGVCGELENPFGGGGLNIFFGPETSAKVIISWKDCLGIIFLDNLISLTSKNVLIIDFAVISILRLSALIWEKQASTALLQCRTFLCRKRWGPQRKDFGGRYGFLIFIGFLYPPPAWKDFFEARKVPQKIFLWWWSCTLSSSLSNCAL